MRKFLAIVLFLVALSQGVYAQEQSWEYPFIKALNYEEKQQWSFAIEELEKSKKLQEDNLLILKELGYCYAQQGDLEKSREYYERVLYLYPEDSNAKKNLEILGENKIK